MQEEGGILSKRVTSQFASIFDNGLGTVSSVMVIPPLTGMFTDVTGEFFFLI